MQDSSNRLRCTVIRQSSLLVVHVELTYFKSMLIREYIQHNTLSMFSEEAVFLQMLSSVYCIEEVLYDNPMFTESAASAAARFIRTAAF